MGVGATLARALPARRDDENGGSERGTEKLSRISRVGRARGGGMRRRRGRTFQHSSSRLADARVSLAIAAF